MTQEALKLALADAKRNERHNNVAETRYWLNQYKLIAEQAIAELESQERNFCPRCGKRNKDIHTCTPPKPEQESKPKFIKTINGEPCITLIEHEYLMALQEHKRLLETLKEKNT